MPFLSLFYLSVCLCLLYCVAKVLNIGADVELLRITFKKYKDISRETKAPELP